MVRVFCFLLCVLPGILLAQDAGSASSPPSDELKALRQMIEQQSRQLDVLAQEIARLNLLLEGKSASGPISTAPAATPTPPPAATPEPAVATKAALPAQAATSPTGPVHIIAKGETLTVIAKRYKVTVTELLKVNKIADVKKLQIGQTLTLPPDAKLQESSTPTPQQ